MKLKYRIHEGTPDFEQALKAFGIDAVQGNEIWWYSDYSFMFGSAGYALVVNSTIKKQHEVILY